jgi:para-nitrobenzyl esterase
MLWDPVVKLGTGALRGATHQGLFRFRNIPFAKPPVGELRWRPPEPPASWRGVRNAKAFGPRPHQRALDVYDILDALVDGSGLGPVKRVAFRALLKHGPKPPESEDCLHLNVCTPDLSPGSRLPVMVWFHGGNHQDGCGSDLLYHGTQLPEHGVVLVTPNYRLGVMGYLCHPDLAVESPDGVSGNYGTLDQIAALRWVQENIHQFGGDPGNVTVFGQSAGGESVAHLLTSPLSKGLFHRAILQSPSSAGQMLHRTRPALRYMAAEDFGGRFATRVVGKGPSQVARMRAMSARSIMRAARASTNPYLFYPVVDGHALPMSPFECFRQGHQHKVPMLIGANHDEGSILWHVLRVPLFHRRYDGIQPRDVARVVREEFGEDAPRLFELYPGLEAGTSEAQTEFLADNHYGTQVRYYAKQHVKAGMDCYLYHFSEVLPLPRQTIGAFHLAEVPYVFGFDSPFLPLDHRTGLPETIARYWTSFARTGSPNGSGRPEWSPCGADANEWLRLDAHVGMQPVPKREQYAILERHLVAQLDSLPTIG